MNSIICTVYEQKYSHVAQGDQANAASVLGVGVILWVLSAFRFPQAEKPIKAGNQTVILLMEASPSSTFLLGNV